MPQTLSAKKALRQARRRATITAKTRAAYKKAWGEVRKKKSKAALSHAFSVLDQAAKKKVIHKKKASRLKRKLSKFVSRKTSPEGKRQKSSRKKA